jgi:hypothetical protein
MKESKAKVDPSQIKGLPTFNSDLSVEENESQRKAFLLSLPLPIQEAFSCEALIYTNYIRHLLLGKAHTEFSYCHPKTYRVICSSRILDEMFAQNTPVYRNAVHQIMVAADAGRAARLEKLREAAKNNPKLFEIYMKMAFNGENDVIVKESEDFRKFMHSHTITCCPHCKKNIHEKPRED